MVQTPTGSGHHPYTLDLKHVYLNTGRSSQATLVGRDETTLESLYYSQSLAEAKPAVYLSIIPPL